MAEKSLVLIGSGGHAKVVLAAARASGWMVTALLDDDTKKHGENVFGVEIRGPISSLGSADLAHIAIGNAAVRMKFDSLGCEWSTIIHPHAYVDSTSIIGAGSFVAAGAVVNSATVVGRHCIINTCASVDHDNVLEDFVQIAPGAHLGGNVTVREGAFVGLGASIIHGVTIGRNALIGAGATIIRDVPDGAKIVGNPGRAI
ncbi:MAG TPA: acetyltransferase [Fimbriimonas sp.]|nr:acetyltransferase [Fimbriimonas sp.]